MQAVIERLEGETAAACAAAERGAATRVAALQAQCTAEVRQAQAAEAQTAERWACCQGAGAACLQASLLGATPSACQASAVLVERAFTQARSTAERAHCLPGIPTSLEGPMCGSALWQHGSPHAGCLPQRQQTHSVCLCRFRVASEALAAAGRRAGDAERRITDLEQHLQNKRTAISELQDQVCQQHHSRRGWLRCHHLLSVRLGQACQRLSCLPEGRSVHISHTCQHCCSFQQYHPHICMAAWTARCCQTADCHRCTAVHGVKTSCSPCWMMQPLRGTGVLSSVAKSLPTWCCFQLPYSTMPCA